MKRITWDDLGKNALIPAKFRVIFHPSVQELLAI